VAPTWLSTVEGNVWFLILREKRRSRNIGSADDSTPYPWLHRGFRTREKHRSGTWYGSDSSPEASFQEHELMVSSRQTFTPAFLPGGFPPDYNLKSKVSAV
jgi:hypothetical protein